MRAFSGNLQMLLAMVNLSVANVSGLDTLKIAVIRVKFQLGQGILKDGFFKNFFRRHGGRKFVVSEI